MADQFVYVVKTDQPLGIRRRFGMDDAAGRRRPLEGDCADVVPVQRACSLFWSTVPDDCAIDEFVDERIERGRG